ncbi:MAG: hypothetical protein NT038_07710 [Euryarchaeota archaeon]|nr:hypothetical protein [Euryarchaeota archaeon]
MMMNIERNIKQLYMDAMYYHLRREGFGRIKAKFVVKRRFYA